MNHFRLYAFWILCISFTVILPSFDAHSQGLENILQLCDNATTANKAIAKRAGYDLDQLCGEVRAEAVTLIGKSCDAEDVQDLLIKKLSDTDPQVRKNTALSLMKLTAFQAIEGLTKAANSEEDSDVKKVINVAIKILRAGNE